jgi:hypothetical protein
MYAPLRTMLAAASAVALVTALSAVPAVATTTTWTVSPGGIAGADATGHLSDTSTGAKFPCRKQAEGERFKRGSGLVDPIGHVFGFSICTPHPGGSAPIAEPLRIASLVSPNLIAVSYDANTGVTTGRITGMQLLLSDNGCEADVDGATASQGGVLYFKYTNGTGILSLFTAGNDLHFFNVSSSCSSTLNINNGDRAAYHANFNLSQIPREQQTITSP